jgi:hypothetical protein
MRTDNIEKVRLKVTLKAGPKEFDPGVYNRPRIDPIILEEVRLETGTVEVLKLSGPIVPVIFAPVFKDPEHTNTSSVITSDQELEEETGTPPILVEDPFVSVSTTTTTVPVVVKKPVLKVRKTKKDKKK